MLLLCPAHASCAQAREACLHSARMARSRQRLALRVPAVDLQPEAQKLQEIYGCMHTSSMFEKSDLGF